MKRGMIQAFPVITLLVGLCALGGCPMQSVPLDEQAVVLAPGTYYVEQYDDTLYYYDLAEVRGADQGWVPLLDEGEWFAGPGFYRLSKDYTWSRDENAADMTLDDIIQLHDPPPPAPEAGL